MKHLLYILSVMLLTAAVQAGPAVRTRQNPYNGWGHDKLSLKEDLNISNNLNFYVFTAAMWKSQNQTQPLLQFWLMEPGGSYGFSRPVLDFFRMEVNGIREFKLHMLKEHIRPWREGENAGFEFTLRFDGAPIRVRWFMRPDSPVLWCRLAPGDNQFTPFQSIKIFLLAVPSKLKLDEKNTTVWDKAYHRQGITAARVLQQNDNFPSVLLNDQDKYLILQDTELDGSDRNKGQGPCIIIPDKAAKGKVKANIIDNWLLQTEIEIPVDFKDYTFGVWTRKQRISNQEVQKMLKKHPGQFSRK